MRASRVRPWHSLLPGVMSGLALIAMLVVLAACAPFGVAPPPPRPALATATASAGAAASPVQLPTFTADPGWVAEVNIADGSKWDGSGLIGTPGSATVSGTVTIGYLTASKAATVVLMFACQSIGSAHSSVTVDVGEIVSGTIQCTPNVAATRDHMQLPDTAIGRQLAVTATITTDGVNPRWNALVEQPK